MKYVVALTLTVVIIFTACDKDESITYPKLYTYSHTEIADGRFYVVEANAVLTPVATPPVYVQFVDTLELFIEETQREFLFFEEFELLSENMIRFKVLLDQMPFDTTVMYTMEEKNIVLDSIDSDFISFDAEADEFHVCTTVQIGIRGPNPPVSGQGYGIIVGTCEHDFTGYLEDIMDQDIYVEGDTLGFYLLNTIYK